MLNFSKLKPQTLHIKPPTLKHPPPNSNPHLKTLEPQLQTQNPHPKPLFQTPDPHSNIENMYHFYLLFRLCHYYLCHFYWTLPTIYVNMEQISNYPSLLNCEPTQ